MTHSEDAKQENCYTNPRAATVFAKGQLSIHVYERSLIGAKEHFGKSISQRFRWMATSASDHLAFDPAAISETHPHLLTILSISADIRSRDEESDRRE